MKTRMTLGVLAVRVMAFVILTLVGMKARAQPFVFHQGGHEAVEFKDGTEPFFKELRVTYKGGMKIFRFERISDPEFNEKYTVAKLSRDDSEETGSDDFSNKSVVVLQQMRVNGNVTRVKIVNSDVNTNVLWRWQAWMNGFYGETNAGISKKHWGKLGDIVMRNPGELVGNHFEAVDGEVIIYYNHFQPYVEGEGRNNFFVLPFMVPAYNIVVWPQSVMNDVSGVVKMDGTSVLIHTYFESHDYPYPAR